MHDYRLPCVSLGLFIYLQTTFSRTCDLEFKDVPSKTFQADFVFEATVHRLGSGAGKGSKDRSIVRFKVSNVLQGTLDKETNTDRYRTISVGRFAAKADPERCVAPLPQLGSRYVLFLRSAETDTEIRATTAGASEGPEFLLSSFPEPFSEDVIASVRRSSGKKFARRPKVQMRLGNVTFEPGEVARVQCIASGRPKPKVNWFKDSLQIQSTKRISFQDTKRGSTLVIRRLSPTDSGIYRCQAVNVVGRTSLDSVKGVYVSIASATTTTTTTETPAICQHCQLCQMDDYCFNGGTCYYVKALNQTLCQCPKNFMGSRCEEKNPGIDARLVSGRGGGSRKRQLLLLKPYAM